VFISILLTFLQPFIIKLFFNIETTMDIIIIALVKVGHMIHTLDIVNTKKWGFVI